MCTAITYMTDNFYFGRNLDYDTSYGESIAVMPRKFPLCMRNSDVITNHYAMIGTAHMRDGYPLYYDAVNEEGLCVAGLNFVGNAYYGKKSPKKCNVAQFEFIPWLLARCADVNEARAEIENMNMTNERYSEKMPPAQLHWIIADRRECITLEITKDGLNIYDNEIGVLTNNPPFPLQVFQLNNYRAISPREGENRFSEKLNLEAYSRGMGGIGLPGDLSSQSRFVRAAFVRENSLSKNDELSSVSQFFHILGSVEQTRGCCETGQGKYEITIYSSCCNADKGIYYYTTYNDRQIRAVDMNKENLSEKSIISYPMTDKQNILTVN